MRTVTSWTKVTDVSDVGTQSRLAKKFGCPVVVHATHARSIISATRDRPSTAAAHSTREVIGMSKQKQIQFQEYRALKNAGWDFDKGSYIKFNSGSESLKHIVAKSIAGHVALNAGYTVASEVETKHGHEADILAYGCEGRQPIVIDLENDYTEEVAKEKRGLYSIGPIREPWIINLDNWQNNDPEWLANHIKEVTGL